MRVCHITSVHPPFDTRIYHRECRSLSQAGYDVTLIAPSAPKASAGDGIRLVALPAIGGRRERPRLWWRIVREVRAMRPAIAHLHDPELLLIAPFLRPAKVIYDCHEPYAETTMLRDWLPRPVRRPLSRLVAVLEPVLARQVSAIVVTEESHATPFRGSDVPVVLVRNFPLLADFYLAHSSDGRTVVHVGVNSEPRGCTAIVQAARWVAQEIRDAKFLIIGDFDPPSYEGEVRRMIVAHGLEGHVFLKGRIPYAEVPQWLAQSDVGLVPWQGPDRFPTRVIPTKLFEYMSARLPVVASDLPTIRRFMDGLDCGFLVDPVSPEALPRAIAYLLAHPTEARRMGGNGRRAVEERYHWQVESSKLLALYRQLADGKTAAGTCESGWPKR